MDFFFEAIKSIVHGKKKAYERFISVKGNFKKGIEKLQNLQN